MLSLETPAQGLENRDVCAVLDIVVLRGKRGPHVPSMAKPVARARWEFWFLVLIVIPFRKLKIPAFLWLGELFLWSLMLNVLWGFCCSHNPAERLQLLCGLLLTWSFTMWAHKQAPEKWGKPSGCLFTAPEPFCAASQLTLPRGWKETCMEGASKEGGNLGGFVLLAQGSCWCGAGSWAVNVLRVRVTPE